MIYHGETITHGAPPPMDGMPGWLVDIRSRFYRDSPKDFAVERDLAQHVIASLVDQDFDVAASRALPAGQGEGHAFAFVHKYLYPDRAIPVVPVLLNTFYPPNQVTPRRAFQIGRAIRRAVESYPKDIRVGIAASGGLSHFVVDEAFDQGVIQALRDKDAEALQSIPKEKMIDGTSETLNWICVGGAVEALPMDWCEYVAGYRSPAGTGVGLTFGVWK
jgi:3-O-methylgallate 3,4-dioxygenase